MKEQKILEQIVRRLDTLISLELARPPGASKVPMASRIERLVELGLSTREIAEILNRPANYITATISQRKRKSGKKGGVAGD